MARGSVKDLPSDFKLRLLIAGGGTGGHLYPGLAIAEAFLDQYPQAEISFLGTARGIEATVVPEAGYPLILLPMRGLLRALSWQNLVFPLRLLWSIGRVYLLVRRMRPHLVIGTGGYVSGPAIIGALLARVPCVIQEQNSYPGLVNRRFGGRVSAVFLSFEASRKYFARRQRIFLTGNPIRSSIAQCDKENALREFGLNAARRTVLLFGGSQGARKLNEVFAECFDLLTDADAFQFLWITGPSWFSRWQHLDHAREDRVRVVAYVQNMSAAYAAADLVVCRAGATTIAELTACGLPAIYIPFPFATADHQTANARAVTEQGGGLLIAERELSAGVLLAEIRGLFAEVSRLAKMAGAARSLARPQAAAEIVARCSEIIAANMG